ncbi:MAG: argininosuccinate lyase [Bacteroidota bacterium]
MENKLWEKEQTRLSLLVEQFTVGRDKEFDLLLAEYDVTGSVAHAAMLESAGLLSRQELEQILSGLERIREEIRTGKFRIEEGVEDVHSQVELLLTRRIGEAGKKLHTGRSRNDQVLLDIKLYLREELRQISLQVKGLFDTLLTLSEKHKDRQLPGYTHFQVAMPSSFGLWFGAYAESLTDDMEMVLAAFHVANRNPLGSAAGYGSSFGLKRGLTTELMNFESLNYNSLYAQMTRGKTEKIVAMAMSCLAATLAKLAFDVCLYTSQDLGFVSFPDELCTGSSIMPHKKNPDVFELIRAKCNRIQALPNELALLTANLPSGYHRDLQLTKEILFPAVAELKACLEISRFMLPHMMVRENILEDKKYDHLFSVEAVNELVVGGLPFREAYKQVSRQIEQGLFKPERNIVRTHEGSAGNLCNDRIKERMELQMGKIMAAACGEEAVWK